MRGKRMLSVAVSAALALSLLPAQAVDVPADQLAGQWYEAAMTAAVERGIIGGDESGNLQPARNITRGEMAVMLDRVMDYQTKADNKFGDLAGGAYYTDAILAASAAGILKGDDLGNVKPGAGITRQETAVMLARMMSIEDMDAPSGNFADQSGIAPWAVKAVNAMKAAGYMGAQEVYFRPLDAITRAEVATVLGNIFAGYFNEAKTYSADVNGSAVVNAAGATLRNMKVTGDLIVAEGVAEGNLYLDGVTVGGRLLVRGGGVNSIYIRGASQVGNVIVSRQDGPIRVVVEGGAKVEVVVVDDGSDAVKLEGTLGSVVIEGAAAVEVAGTVGTVTVDAPDASLKVSGTVAKVATTENAAGAVIEAAAGGKITAVEANGAGTQVTGSGKVDSVSAKANGVSVATPNTKVEAAPGTSGVTAGGKPVEGGSTGGGSTGGGGGYVPPSPVAPSITISGIPETIAIKPAVAEANEYGLVSAFDESGKTPIDVSLVKGTVDYSKVRVIVGIEGPANGVQLLAKDTSNQWWNIVKSGWGPAEGFALANATTPVYPVVNKSGRYTVTIKLIDKVNSDTVLATMTKSVTAVAESDLTEALAGKVNTFGTTFVNKNISTIDGKEAVYYVEIGAYTGAASPTEAKINGTTYSESATYKMSVGNNHFLNEKVWKIDGGKLLVSLPYLCVETLTEKAAIEVGGAIYSVKCYDSSAGALTVVEVGVLGTQSGHVNKIEHSVDGNVVTHTFSHHLHYLGLKLSQESSYMFRKDMKANPEPGENLVGVVSPVGGYSYTGYLWYGTAAVLVGEVITFSKDYRIVVPGKGYVDVKLVGNTVAKDTKTLLEWAKAYVYPDYTYTGISVITENAIVYTAPAADFVKEGDANTRATMDLARLLGALYRMNDGKSVSTITYDGKEYTWDSEADPALKGSNWKNGGDTLVSAIVKHIEENKSSLGTGVKFTLTIAKTDVEFTVKAQA